MTQTTASLDWLAETARTILAEPDAADIAAYVRDRVATHARADAAFYRRAGEAAYAVDALDDAEGAACTEPAILAAFARARAHATDALVVVPIAGRDGAARWVLAVRFRAGAAVSGDVVAALDLLGTCIAGAARARALERELDASRATIVRLAFLKADLVTILAHDFKSPLTTVMGYAELMADGGLDEETLASAVGAIASAARKLASMANDTLALARVDATELALDRDLLDLTGLVEDAARRSVADGRVTVERPTRAALVDGDVQRLRYVFEQLLDNALAFSPDGGDVSVAIAADDERVTVRVRDAGIGIPPADLARVFDRFARAENARGIAGLGLGLGLVRSLVESHGGTVALAAAEPHGTTATVTLPAVGGVAPRALPRTLVIAKPTDATAYVAYALRSHGYTVRIAADVRDAAVRLQRDAYDLAIVDARAVDPHAAAALFDAHEGPPMPRLLIAPVHAPIPEGWSAVVRAPYLVRDVTEAAERCFPVL